MSGSTSVPGISFGPTGFVAPAESEIVAGLALDMTAAFGGNLDTSPSSPQGQIISSTAAMLGNSNNQQALLYNGMDPSYAAGRMQDAIGRIYFMTRIAGQPTTLQVACVGLPGVVIPSNAIIVDPAGNQYLCTTPGIIPISGTITLSFACSVIGPVAVPPSVTIYQTIANWNTATLVSGAVGQDVESRSAFETRRAASVASNAAGFTNAMLGALLAVAGVSDAFVVDNPSNTSQVEGGVTLAANSIYASVAGGGTAADIGFAIWSRKSPGCSYNGSTSTTVVDPNPAYNGSGPSYTVSWTTATNEPVAFTVTLKNSSSVPANATTLIANAIATAFTGQDNGPPTRIGQMLFASRYYAGIAALGWAQIISVQLGCQGSPSGLITAAISGTTMTVSAVSTASFTGVGSGTTLTASAVTGTICVGATVTGTGIPAGTIIVAQLTGLAGGAGNYQTSAATTVSGATVATPTLAIGQFIYGTGTASGTYITALGSGTGGTGTYTLSVMQNVGSESMSVVSPTYNDVPVYINQKPTFAGGDAIATGTFPDVNVVLI